MTIQFSQVPSNLRVPLVSLEIAGSASTSQTFRTLLVGQMTSAGTGTANSPVQVDGYGTARTLFGTGSMLSLMVKAYLENDPLADLWCLPIADNGAGTASVWTITVDTGTAATEAGTFYIYAAGQRFPVAVAIGDTDAEVALAIKDAFDAVADLPFTVAITNDADDNKVVLTCRHKGDSAGDWLVGVNLGGAAKGESFPAGVSLTSITATTPGATEPSLTTAIGNMADLQFDFIGFPYTDSTSLAAIAAELVRRQGPTVQEYSIAFTAARGSSSTVTTLTGNYDEKALTVLGFSGAYAADYLRAAAYVGASANSLRQLPSRPLTGLPLRGVDVTPEASVYTLAQRNVMHNAGAASALPDASRRYDRINVPTATYTTNEDGAASTTFWRVERTATGFRYARSARAAIEAQFARSILVADGTPVSAGVPVATPTAIRQAVIAHHDSRVLDGWVQDPEGFAESILVELDATPGRVNVYCEPALADQLTVVAARAQFQG